MTTGQNFEILKTLFNLKALHDAASPDTPETTVLLETSLKRSTESASSIF